MNVIDAMKSGYDTNWASLRERVAQSQTRSKKEFAKLKAIENRPKSGRSETEASKPTTVWCAVSKRDVTKLDIENRCKKYAEISADADKDKPDLVRHKSCSIPRPSFRRQGSRNAGAEGSGHHKRVAEDGDQEPSVPGTELDQKGQAGKDANDAKNQINMAPQCCCCGQTVYPKELLEPRKGAAFHERCFRCEECGLKLSLKTFVANQKDASDPRVYCKNHAPQLDAARVDHTAKIISSCQQVPKVAVFNGQIRGPDAGKAVKYDTRALGMQTALNAPRLSQRTSHHPPPPDVVKSDVIGLRYF